MNDTIKAELERIRKEILDWRHDDTQLIDAAFDLLNKIEKDLKNLIKKCAN